MHHLAGYIREAEPPALVFEGESFVVDAEQVQQRGVEIMNVNRILHDVIAKLTSFTVDQTPLHPTSRHPSGEASRMMVPTVVGAGEFSL